MANETTQEAPVLLIDDREQTNAPERVKQIMRRRTYQSKVERILVGDYLLGDSVMEFKLVPDFINSMKSGHLEQQLNELEANYPGKAILVVCGNLPEARYTRAQWRSNPVLWENTVASYRGQIWSIIEKRQIKLLWVKDVEEFCDFLVAKAKRVIRGEQMRGRPVTQKSRDRLAHEEAEDALCAITGIGRDAAKALLVAGGSVAGVAAMEPKRLMEVDGIGRVRAEHVHRILNQAHVNLVKEEAT